MTNRYTYTLGKCHLVKNFRWDHVETTRRKSRFSDFAGDIKKEMCSRVAYNC